MPSFAGSKPKNDPGPGKGGTASATVSAKDHKGKVLLIRTPPPDSKGDKVTVGKNGEILIPRGPTEAMRAGGRNVHWGAPQTPPANAASSATERTIFIAMNRCDKRFDTNPPLSPPPAAPQVEASKQADAILKSAAQLLVQAGAQ